MAGWCRAEPSCCTGRRTRALFRYRTSLARRQLARAFGRKTMLLINSKPCRRDMMAAALAGLFGALVLFAGDMLMYGHFGSGRGFEERHRQVIAAASTSRLITAGILGAVSLLGYLPGAIHVFWRISPCRYRLQGVMFLGLALTFILAGAEHVALGALALAQKASTDLPAAKPVLIVLREYLGAIYRSAEIVGYPTQALLFILVLLRKTSFPRWSALANPGLFMLLSPLTDYIPAPLGAVIAGGTYNLSFSLFFILALVTLNKMVAEPRSQDATGGIRLVVY
jgi:hypothetical protein